LKFEFAGEGFKTLAVAAKRLPPALVCSNEKLSGSHTPKGRVNWCKKGFCLPAEFYRPHAKIPANSPHNFVNPPGQCQIARHALHNKIKENRPCPRGQFISTDGQFLYKT
jgi:hypothetical protein